MILRISDLNGNIDRLKKVHLFIASENTWQGIIINHWPYDQSPPIISLNFLQNSAAMALIDLSENVFKNREGDTNYTKCFNTKTDDNCTSIFDIAYDENLNR